MYRYDSIDQTLIEERVAEFRDQTRRFLAGKLSEDEFRPLRLRNGLYIQRHAPMLRISIPYGLLSTRQLRNPYVDPMHLMQVDLLRRWRATAREDEDLFRALLASVSGIAQGLQTTG